MGVLNKVEIDAHLSVHLKKWAFDGNAIRRDLKFRSFTEAFSFMTAVALEAEKMDHHPDWSNAYNRVSIALRTHSANGITRNDLDLAAKIEQIVANYSQAEK